MLIVLVDNMSFILGSVVSFSACMMLLSWGVD